MPTSQHSLLHDVQKKDMIAYYSAMTCGCEMNANMTDELNASIVVPSAAIGFTVYDTMKSWLRVPSRDDAN
ncbi:hypothetical protein P8452_15036 [Trifolium repens]|nr:hypothetical protein P8452_15036 [Trifolium repens]